MVAMVLSEDLEVATVDLARSVMVTQEAQEAQEDKAEEVFPVELAELNKQEILIQVP